MQVFFIGRILDYTLNRLYYYVYYKLNEQLSRVIHMAKKTNNHLNRTSGYIEPTTKRGAKEGEVRTRWTAMEDNILFNYASTCTGKELEAMLPNRSYAAIKSRMHTLNIKKNDERLSLPWTEEDDALLRKWFNVIGAQTTRSRYLPHRTKSSVYSRAARLGLVRRTCKLGDEDKDLIFELFINSGLSVTEIADKFELSVPYTNRMAYCELEARHEQGEMSDLQYYKALALRSASASARFEAISKIEELVKKQAIKEGEPCLTY